MKIAQIAPLMESVPPRLYGGSERIVAWLTDELVRQGHDVTLFASGDSRTSARLVAGAPRALRLANVRDPLPYHLVMLDEVNRLADRFDILHFHVDLLHYPLIREYAHRTVTTLHGRLDLPDSHFLYRSFRQAPLVSISNNQRLPMPPVNWVGTVHHGLPENLLTPQAGRPDDYVAFLGRISPEKRPDRAIEIADRAGVPLLLAAKIDAVDREYWARDIAPLLAASPRARHIGEIGDAQKRDFLGRARALLFPIDWAEPFGLVMIEAMACGTPVIAWRNGSVTEVIDDGVTGFVVDSIEQAIEALRRVADLDRNRIRQVFEQRFTARRMTDDYLAIYRRLLANAATGPAAAMAPMRVQAGD